MFPKFGERLIEGVDPALETLGFLIMTKIACALQALTSGLEVGTDDV